MSDTVKSVAKHGTESVADQAEVGKLLVNGRMAVQWVIGGHRRSAGPMK